jgi:DNA-binding transcriptional LysR family regulator
MQGLGSRKIASSVRKIAYAWDDLRHFLAFARAGSMQAAANALGVNQSTVQRRIAELEESAGHRLVERHLVQLSTD